MLMMQLLDAGMPRCQDATDWRPIYEGEDRDIDECRWTRTRTRTPTRIWNAEIQMRGQGATSWLLDPFGFLGQELC